MHLVDERHGPPTRRLEAEVAATAPVPGLELYLSATAASLVFFLCGLVFFILAAGCRFARLGQEVVLIDER